MTGRRRRKREGKSIRNAEVSGEIAETDLNAADDAGGSWQAAVLFLFLFSKKRLSKIICRRSKT